VAGVVHAFQDIGLWGRGSSIPPLPLLLLVMEKVALTVYLVRVSSMLCV
jgi:hypothetical protein